MSNENTAELNRRLTLVLSNFGPGGAERALSTMANYWAQQGRPVTLITFSPASEDHYQLHERVNRVSLEIYWRSKSNLVRMRDAITRVVRIRRAIRRSQPDVVISFVDKTNIRVLMSLLGTGIPVIVSERTNPASWSIGWVWSLARKILYRRADAVVSQTQNVRQWLSQFVDPDRVVAIPNAVRVPPVQRKPGAANRAGIVVAMGRMSAEKGFDLLLQAWAALGRQRDGWRLLIIGDGPLRAELEAQASDLDVAESIEFAGLVEDPEALLVQADIYVLPSRIEGFPNALLEAMSLGLAAVSFDCDSGPRDIIRPDIDGLLVPAGDVAALSAAVGRLMSDTAARERLGTAAQAVTERFSQDRIMLRWQALIDSILERRSVG